MLAPLLASGPLAAVLLLMLAFRWRAGPAALVALLMALTITHFGRTLGLRASPDPGTGIALAGSGLEAASTTATILWIIFPALLLYELQKQSGQLEVIRAALGRLSAHPRTQVIFIAWFFGLYLEGASGFGAPVALAAPLLVALGHPPVRAVVLALLGHAAGVAFGALGTPVNAQAVQGSLSPEAIALPTAVLSVLPGLVLLAALVWLADARPPTRADWARAALAAACFYLPFGALAAFAGHELPTLGGAVVGALLFGLLQARTPRPDEPLDRRALIQAAAPYALVVGLVLLTRLIGPLREVLEGVEIAWSWRGEFHGAARPLFHAGTLLLLSVAGGAWIQGRPPDAVVTAAGAALRRLAPVAAALLVMLTLSRVMIHGGLVAELGAAGAAAGPVWPLLAPGVGAIGSFVTGSATTANILLTPVQAATAAELGLSPSLMAAGQGVGAAVGNVTCPHNVLAGAAAVGLRGVEGDILRRTAPVAAAALLAAGGGLFLAG